jgi:putative Holliday junction resolvase
MSVPVVTLPRVSALEELVALANDYEPIEFVVGLPLGLNGGDTPSTDDARGFATELHARTGVPVRLVDERLSTVAAQHALHDAAHTTKSSRGVIDQVAATLLLDAALDAERAGNTLGETLGES